MIRRKRADSYVYRLYCDQCGAEMRATGHKLAGDPPRFVHLCTGDDCTHQERISGVKYPLIDTIEVNEQIMDVPNSPTPAPDPPAA